MRIRIEIKRRSSCWKYVNLKSFYHQKYFNQENMIYGQKAARWDDIERWIWSCIASSKQVNTNPVFLKEECHFLHSLCHHITILLSDKWNPFPVINGKEILHVYHLRSVVCVHLENTEFETLKMEMIHIINV